MILNSFAIQSFESLFLFFACCLGKKGLHSLFIRLFAERDSTIQDFHDRTMLVISKPYFESENIINN